MSLSFSDLSSAAGLKQLNAYFLGRTFVFGIGPSAADAELLKLVGKAPDASAYPHAARWFNYISSIEGKFDAAPAGLSVGVGSAAAAAPAAAEEEEEDDDDDLFGDDSEEEEEEEIEIVQKLPKLRQRTQMVFEIKPADDQVDLDDLGKKVKVTDFKGFKLVEDKLKATETDPRCTMEKCLIWGEAHEVQPVAYTIMKLVVTCIVIDDIVDGDDIIEMLQEKFGEDVIQSVDCKAVNKASAIKLPK